MGHSKEVEIIHEVIVTFYLALVFFVDIWFWRFQGVLKERE